MKKHFVTKRQDETVHITIVNDGRNAQKEVDFWNNRWQEIDGESATPIETVEVAEKDIPKSREFRGAWRLQGNKVIVDPAKQAEIAAERAARGNE